MGMLLLIFVNIVYALPLEKDNPSVKMTRMGFGSCNDQGKKQMMWPAIKSREPELWLWLGDNVR